MAKSVIIDKTGFTLSGIKIVNLSEQEKLGPDEVRIKNKFVGLNTIDIDAAMGKHPMLNDHGTLGFEAVGEILECGKNVTRFSEGEYIGCATNPKGGALAESMVVDQKHLVVLPEEIAPKNIAASLFKGMVAHYLVTRAYIVVKEMPVLIHDVASAQGQYLARWARSYGAIIFGTIADKSQVDIAEAAGCHACYSYNDSEWAVKLLKNTENYGVACIYDSIGKDVFEQSMKALANIGIMIMYGASSGGVKNIPLNLIQEKSLFVTAPSLFHYKSQESELAISAAQLFHAIEVGILDPKIANEISLDDVPAALTRMHQDHLHGSIVVAL